jgi:hypothetical protein
MSSCAPSLTIGPYVVGEKPAPLLYQFQDANGTPIDLSGYTAVFIYHERYGVPVEESANVVDPTNGQVQFIWDGDEFPTPGQYQARFWAGNGTNRFASLLIRYSVAATSPVPAI